MSGWLGTVTQIAGLVVDIIKSAQPTAVEVRRIRLEVAQRHREALAYAERIRNRRK